MPESKKDDTKTKEEAPFMRTSFKVTVTKTEMKSVLKGHQWVKGGVSEKDGTYGYTPMISTLEEVATEVFSQVVEKLDLSAVIKAVNGMT